MRQECRERFLHHRLQRRPHVNYPDMHHGTCVTHVPWCMSGSLTSGGGENVPGIPGASATRNFTLLSRGHVIMSSGKYRAAYLNEWASGDLQHRSENNNKISLLFLIYQCMFKSLLYQAILMLKQNVRKVSPCNEINNMFSVRQINHSVLQAVKLVQPKRNTTVVCLKVLKTVSYLGAKFWNGNAVLCNELWHEEL